MKSITYSGQPCRKCGTPVRRMEHGADWKPKPGRCWYRWWFRCDGCKTTYLVNEAAVFTPGKQLHPDLFEDDQIALDFANELYLKHNRNLE